MATFTSNGTPITQPSPQYDLPIYCNNGKISVLDHTNWTIKTNPNSEAGQGIYINTTNGRWYSSNDRGAGAIIPITVGKKYTMLINKKTLGLGNFLRYGQSATSTPSGQQLVDWYAGVVQDGQIVSFTAKKDYFVFQMGADFVEGGGIDEAIEIIEAAGDNETIAITTRNIFDLSCITDKTYNGITLTVNRNTGEITTTGYTTASAGYSQLAYDLPEPLTAGTYTISLYNSEIMSGSLVGFPINNAVAGRTCSLATTTNNKATITVPEGSEATQIWLRIKGFQDDPTHQFKFKIQVEKGSEGTSYIAHNSSTATANNLFAINTYKDVQEIITGATTHNLGVLVCNGTEDWLAHNSVVGWFRLVNSNLFPKTIQQVVCSHYKFAATQATGQYVSCGSAAGTDPRIIIADNVNFPTTGDTTAFKAWLAAQYAAGTPVIIVYPLATPFEEVAPIAQTMTVVDGDNTVSLTQQGMTPLTLEATYMKK